MLSQRNDVLDRHKYRSREYCFHGVQLKTETKKETCLFFTPCPLTTRSLNMNNYVLISTWHLYVTCLTLYARSYLKPLFSVGQLTTVAPSSCNIDQDCFFCILESPFFPPIMLSLKKNTVSLATAMLTNRS